MSENYLSKFYALGYTHEEIESLLSKIENRSFLTEDEYKRLVVAIEIIDALATFDGSYDSLSNKPDIIDVVRQSKEFAPVTELEKRIIHVHKYVAKTLEDFKKQIDEEKADIDHKHDDRYSLINHDHKGVYVSTKELNDYVSKEYLETVLKGFEGGGGGGGSIYPTYVQPKISVKANVSTVKHKKSTVIVLTPEYAQNDAGELVKFTIIKDGAKILELTEVKGIEETIVLKHGETANYTFTVEFKDGVIKDTTAGDPYPDTSIKAGTIVAGITIKCNADSYVGVIPDRALSQEDISSFSPISLTSKSYTYTYSLNEQKSVFMYPKSFGILNSIKDANGFEYLDSYDQLIFSYDDLEYYAYILSDITVMNKFKQVFS